jgi:hypothetical protein
MKRRAFTKLPLKCLVCKWRGMYCIKTECKFRLRKLDEFLIIDFDYTKEQPRIWTTLKSGKRISKKR